MLLILLNPPNSAKVGITFIHIFQKERNWGVREIK